MSERRDIRSRRTIRLGPRSEGLSSAVMEPSHAAPVIHCRLAGALLTVLIAPAAMAQQPVQPLPKVGGCPLGYYTSGSYCVPSKSTNSRGALQKIEVGAFYWTALAPDIVNSEREEQGLI